MTLEELRQQIIEELSKAMEDKQYEDARPIADRINVLTRLLDVILNR